MTAALDLGPIKRRNSDLAVQIMKIMLLSQLPPPDEIDVMWQNIIEAMTDLGAAVAEIEGLRAGRQRIRDIHVPKESADPAAPGAVCTGCSMHGALVPWPCATWKAVEDQ